ncbi:MAG TPA: TolC family protein [Thermoanaerobaculia bacterium]|nr:TolC family protein [Thermoanaerobaculia bacterium]
MKRFVFVAVCFAALPAAAQTRLTFHDALSRALEVNNTIESSRAQLAVADEARKQMLSSILPQIGATGSTIKNSKEVTFGSGSDSRIILPSFDWNYRVVLSQPVFAGLREQRAYGQAKIGVQNAQESVLGTEDAVLLRVASNYLAAVDADARMEIEKQNIALAQRRLDQANAFYEAGEVTKVDVLRAQTAIKDAQRQLAAAEQNRVEAVSRLRADLDLTGALAVERPQQPLPSMPEEQALVTEAQTGRPDVVLARNNVKAAHLEVLKQKGAYLPVVTFDAGYVDQKSAFPTNKYGYGAFRFTVPIWQSGSVGAQVAQAREKEIQAGLALQDAQTAAREDVVTAVSNLQQTSTSLQLAKEQLTAAEAEYQQEFDLYRAQEATSLDLAASETSLADARRAVEEATLNHDLAQLRVWYAAGALKSAVGLPAAGTAAGAPAPAATQGVTR